MSVRIAIVVFAFAIVPCTADGQTGTIAGTVTVAESGAPRPGASIALTGTTRGVIADTAGRFVIAAVTARGWQIRVRLLGYEDVTRTITVRPGETTFVSVALVASTRTLGEVRTEGRSAERVTFLSRPAVATTTINAHAVEAVPRLGEPDIIRVVQLLPGVAAKNDFWTGYNVRGGEADQNLILIDGYPTYNPFHLGGLFSTFMNATVRDATLITGAFPARYGGRLSSVLDVRSAIEERPGLHGSGEVSLLGATGALAGSLGGKGSWLLAARRTYADKVVDAFSDEVLPYHFRDLHGHVDYKLPRDLRLGVTAYVGEDVLDANLAEVQDDSAQASAGEGTFRFLWGNAVLGGTLARVWSGAIGSDSLRTEVRVSRSRFFTDIDAGEGSSTVYNSVLDWRTAANATRFSRRHDVTIGAEVSRLRLNTQEGTAQTSALDVHRLQEGNVFSVFIDDLWRPSSRWLVQGGLRVESIDGIRSTLLSPRLSAKFFVTPDVAVTAGGGRFTQWTHSLGSEDSAIRFFDFWVMSDSAAAIGSAWHGVIGAEQWFGSGRQFRAEAFVKDYDTVLEASMTEDPFVDGDEFAPMRGRAYGIDILVRQFESPGQRLSGWLSYIYAVAWREQDGVRFSPGHDRRHNLNLVASWKAGPYQLGARLGLASGTPYTAMVGQFVRRKFNPATNTWEPPGAPPQDVDYLGGVRNGARYPVTQRLDLNASRDFQRGRATIRPFVSVVNAYNARNVFLYILDYGEAPPIRRTISQFPILPSAGLSIVF